MKLTNLNSLGKQIPAESKKFKTCSRIKLSENDKNVNFSSKPISRENRESFLDL